MCVLCIVCMLLSIYCPGPCDEIYMCCRRYVMKTLSYVYHQYEYTQPTLRLCAITSRHAIQQRAIRQTTLVSQRVTRRPKRQ